MSDAVPSWFHALKSSGVENLCTDPCAIQGVVPAGICTPADEKEAAAAVRCAAAHHLQIVPCGGLTQQSIGRAPQADFLALSTRRLNTVIHHEPGDMVATVQAGMELGAFQQAIGARGQWLPVDGNPKSTIGGLIATNHSGPRGYGYGTLRDMVLGMTVINGDGVARKCGGKVVKNVTGYALDKLYIGSLGTLGVVSEVTFKLLPKVVARWEWQIGATTYEQAVESLQRIDGKNLPLEVLVASGSFPAAENLPWTVCASAAGTLIELARIEQEIGLACDAGRVKRVERSTEWTGTEPALKESEYKVRFWCRRATLHSILDFLILIPSRVEVSPYYGTVSLTLTPDLAAKVSKELTALGVNFQFENAPSSKVANIDQPFGPPRPEWPLMKRIKLALDPQSILNTGRFVV